MTDTTTPTKGIPASEHLAPSAAITAEFPAIGVRSLYRRHAAGELTMYKLGRRTLWDRREIAALITKA